MPFFRLFYLIFLLSISLFPSASTWGQSSTTQIQTFGVTDGLSSRFIHCFLQDSQGFLWVGTDYGLNKFDGFRFKVYTQEQDGLQSNQIGKMIEDAEGNIWLTSSAPLRYLNRGTVEIFNPISEKSIALSDWVENPAVLENEKITGISSKDGKQFFLTLASGKILLCQNKKLTVYTQIPEKFILIELLPNPDGSLWGNTEREIVQIGRNNSWEVLAVAPPKRLFSFIQTQAGNKNIYYELGAVNKGKSQHAREVRRLDSSGKDELLFKISAAYLRLKLNLPQKEALVIRNEDNELGTLSFAHSLAGEFKPMNAKIREISTSTVSITDRQEGFWKDNPPYGIMRIQSVGNVFHTFLNNRPTQHQPTTATRGIWADKLGNLIVGSRKEIISFNKQTYQQVNSSLIRIPNNEKEFTLLSVHKESDSLWASTSNAGLFNRKENGQFSYFPYKIYSDSAKNKQLNKIWHWSLFRDSKSKLWLGHQFGLSYLDGREGKLHFYEQYNGFNELQNTTVYHFHENAKGIWLATSDGLYLLDAQKGIQQRFHSDGEGENYLSHSQINHLYEDKAGYFWLATKGGGLIKWHPESKDYKQFTTQNGLSHNVLYAVYPDDFGNLWLSSNQGIMRFEKESQFVTTYLPSDGISHEEFNRISHFQNTRGEIYFGGLDGITTFDPQDFQLNTKARQFDFLRFTECLIQNGKSGKWDNTTSSLIKSQQIVLNPSSLGFTLTFADLDFRNSQKKQFAYLIEGLETDWHYQSNNSIRVGQLPYGTFRLRLKSQDKNGIWGKEKVLEIISIKPFYLQIWFLTLAVFSLVLLVFLFVKWRTYQLERKQQELLQEVRKRTLKIEQDKEVIQKQAEELSQLDKLKSRFFTNISHELRTPLTLILGPAKLIQSTENNLSRNVKNTFQSIEQHGNNLLDLVEEILELSKLEANQIELHEHPTDLQALLYLLSSNFEQRAEQLGIRFQFSGWQNEKQVLLDAKKTGKIINNLIANALKFTSKNGEIVLNLSESNSAQIILSVTDTGKGIHPDDLPHIFERFFQSKKANQAEYGGTGIGLALSKELAEAMSGNLSVNSELGKGSVFTLILPLKYASQNELISLPIGGLPNPVQVNPIGSENKAKIAPKNGETILIVEDNLDMQKFISSILDTEYQIYTAHNGQEAIEWLEGNKSTKIDLIVSDIMMPELDGFGFLSFLKSSEKWQTIPVVMLTARISEDYRLQALQVGVDDYLTKPFSPLELQARVRNLLNNYQERKIWKEIMPEEIQEELSSIELSPEFSRLSHAEVDKEWLNKLGEVIVEHIGNHQFTISDLADDMNLSQRQMSRKLKSLTGLTPLKYQKEIQLQNARKLLEKGAFTTVAEVVQASGFHTHHHFTSLYIERFGKMPSEYL